MKTRRLYIYLYLVVLFLGFSSCNVYGKVKFTESDLNGEWNIVEAGGQDITKATDGNRAYIGLDVNGKRLYGCAGCNRLLGQISLNFKKGTLSFGSVGSTKMLCANMEVERLVLESINNVSTFKMNKNGTLEMRDASGKTLMKLKKK